MPNYAYSSLKITGDRNDIDKIIKTEFDFNMIIPPPQGLVDDCEEYCSMCKSREFIDADTYSRHCVKCDVNSNIGGSISSWAKTDKERYRQLTKNEIKLAKKWRKEYGTDSWYEWNVSNWGTKWNASYVKVKRFKNGNARVTFQTAWGPPMPIFERLAKDYNVRIDGTFEIEGEDGLYKESWLEESSDDGSK